MNDEHCCGDVGARVDDALCLKEFLDWEVAGVGEDLRDESHDEDGGCAGDLFGLAD